MKRLVVGATALTLLVACAPSSEGSGPLVVYSGRAEELVAPIFEDFTEATGIELEVRYAGSSELAATLLAEGQDSDADVFFSQDPASLGAVEPMLASLPQESLELVEARFRDPEGRWVGTSGRSRVVVYNTAADLDLPETIDDMTDPQWVGQLGIAPTNASFLAFVAAMILERGEDATREWLEAIAANDPIEFDGNAPIVEATDNGELYGGLVNHYYLLRLRAEGLGQNAENHFLEDGDVGALVMPAGAGILGSTDQEEAALELIGFLLTAEVQEYFAIETFEYPLIEGVSEPEGAPPLSELHGPDIDLGDLADVIDDATRLVAESGLV